MNVGLNVARQGLGRGKALLFSALGQATVRIVYICPIVVWRCMVAPG